MKMIVSGIIRKGDEKFAYVLFSDGERSAEGQVPKCKITNNNGFTDAQIAMLEDYMREHISEIKAEAAGMNPIKAMMKNVTKP